MAVQALSFKSAWGSLRQLGNVEPRREAPGRVRLRAVAFVADLTPKELHHQRKKEWKRLHRAWRLEKLAERAREQERLVPVLGVVQLREVQARRAQCRLRNGRRVSKGKPRS
jgi:hypothetical protein